ncbi:MAG: tetratricopeptide repeat protein, partial [bacterium]
AENPFSGADIFQSVDAMTVQLKHDLEIPAYHIEQTEDLPVSEILTNSISAYRMRIAAMYARLHDNDYNGAAKHLEKAVEEDPFFAYAHYRLYRVYAALNQRDHAERAISTALQHKHNLPERYQFWVKNAYYRTKEEMQQVFENAKNWVALYPETTDGHHILANQYENMNQFNEAIEEHRRIFELDPEAFRELHHIGALYKAKGEFEEALKYYGQYAEIFPKEYHSFEEIGDLYQTMGDYEGAKSNYKKARLMEPEEISILSRLGMIEIKLGNFRQALEQYQDALKIAKTPQDRSTVYAYLADYSTFRGQIRKALEYYDFQFAELEKFTPPQGLLGQKFMVMANYALIGKEDEAFRILKGLEAQQLMPPFNLFPSLGYLMVYMVLEDADKAEKAADEFESFIEITKLEVLRPILFMARGQIHEFREEYTQAIEYYEKAYENAQPEMKKFINLLYGESYRELKEFEKAEEYIHQTLKIEPFLPDAHYEIALVYYDMGKKEKALEHLKKALYVWGEADPEFKPAKEAREKLAEWEPVTSKM